MRRWVVIWGLLGVLVGVVISRENVVVGMQECAAVLGSCQQDLAEGAPDVVYELAWVDYDCSFIGNKLPKAIHPIACDPRVRVYRAAEMSKILSRLDDLGPDVSASIFEERGAREKVVKHVWRSRKGG